MKSSFSKKAIFISYAWEPKREEIVDRIAGAFVDGGVSMANNPSLALLMVATLKGFPFGWKMSADKLELVSVGTGYSIFSKKTDAIEDNWILNWAKTVPDMLMQDASWQNQILMQWLSDSPTAFNIDLQTGTMEGDHWGVVR